MDVISLRLNRVRYPENSVLLSEELKKLNGHQAKTPVEVGFLHIHYRKPCCDRQLWCHEGELSGGSSLPILVHSRTYWSKSGRDRLEFRHAIRPELQVIRNLDTPAYRRMY